MGFAQGNVFGRTAPVVTDALRRAAMAGDQKLLRRAVTAALTQAANGSLPHLAWIADRLEGKAVARLETASADARELDLAAVVQAVLTARASSAQDAVLTDSDSAALVDYDNAHTVRDASVRNDSQVANENHSHLAPATATPDP